MSHIRGLISEKGNFLFGFAVKKLKKNDKRKKAKERERERDIKMKKSEIDRDRKREKEIHLDYFFQLPAVFSFH